MRNVFKIRVRSQGYNFIATAFSRVLHSGDTYTNLGTLTFAPSELEFFIKNQSDAIVFEAADERSRSFLIDHCSFRLKDENASI